jgi:hypothetical protein
MPIVRLPATVPQPSNRQDASRWLLNMAKLDLRSRGIILKRVPAALMKDLGDNIQAEGASGLKMAKDLHMRDMILRWLSRHSGRAVGQGLRANLKWLLKGRTYGLKWPQYVVALKETQVRVVRNGMIQMVNDVFPVAFIVYGEFNPNQSYKSEQGDEDSETDDIYAGDVTSSWKVDFTGQGSQALDTAAAAGKVAEISIVTSAVQSPEGTSLARGIGQLMFDYAVADIASRNKGGHPRFSHVVTFAANQDLATRIQHPSRGFTEVNYQNVPHSNWAETARAYKLNLDEDTLNNYQAAMHSAVRGTNLHAYCPPAGASRTGLRHWSMCQ